MVGTSVIALNFTFNFIFHNIFYNIEEKNRQETNNFLFEIDKSLLIISPLE